METKNISKDIKTFGFRVNTFPMGIGEAFDQLIKRTGDKAGERNYYGISYMQDGEMVYNVAAEEKEPGEAEKYNFPRFTIESGDYISEELKNWQANTQCIKDIFQRIMNDGKADNKKPAIEWYKNDDEMFCMVKAK